MTTAGLAINSWRRGIVASGGNCFRLSMGLARLEQWAAGAGQVDKNAAYKALFAISDGSFFRTYKVLDDVDRTGDFFVLVRQELVIKVRFYQFNEFGIVYIGSLDEAPDIDFGVDRSA